MNTFLSAVTVDANQFFLSFVHTDHEPACHSHEWSLSTSCQFPPAVDLLCSSWLAQGLFPWQLSRAHTEKEKFLIYKRPVFFVFFLSTQTTEQNRKTKKLLFLFENMLTVNIPVQDGWGPGSESAWWHWEQSAEQWTACGRRTPTPASGKSAW